MGLSGFRVSVLMTHNKQLHAVLNELIRASSPMCRRTRAVT